MDFHATQTLRDLGERRIVHELIIPRFEAQGKALVKIGDDCAVLPAPSPDEVLVMTTDPCPIPVICILDQPDFYHYGRMTALINVSDLAAMGARPLGLLVSTVMPEEMAVAEYERFLEGLAEATQEWDCPVVGGNIKDGPSFTATGSALGAVKRECLMLRTGAKPDDHVLIVGEMGLFWAAVVRRLKPDIQLDTAIETTLRQCEYRPVARIREGRALAQARLATACIDSSDGVFACLRELAMANAVDIVVHSASLRPATAVSRVASAGGIDPRKLMLAWGDWQLVCTVRPEHVNSAIALIESLGTPCYDIGEVCEGAGMVWLQEGTKRGRLANLASERFAATSLFSHGLEAFLDILENAPLTTPSA